MNSDRWQKASIAAGIVGVAYTILSGEIKGDASVIAHPLVLVSLAFASIVITTSRLVRSRADGWTVGGVAVSVLLVGVVGFSIGYRLGGEDPVAGGPEPSASPTSTQPEHSPAPSSSSTQPRPTSPQPSPTSETPGPESPYRLEFQDGSFVDIDSGTANLEGGRDYEVKLSYGRLFFGEKYDTWADTKVVYIKQSDESWSGCARGTRLQEEVAHLNDVAQDDSVCVYTSNGAWAGLRLVDGPDLNVKTFDVTLYEPTT
jgi:hypothetical protein